MTLRENMAILAMDSMELAIAVGGEVTPGIIERAMDGQVIPAQDAARIMVYLARRFGAIGPYVIDDLVTIGQIWPDEQQ